MNINGEIPREDMTSPNYSSSQDCPGKKYSVTNCLTVREDTTVISGTTSPTKTWSFVVFGTGGVLSKVAPFGHTRVHTYTRPPIRGNSTPLSPVPRDDKFVQGRLTIWGTDPTPDRHWCKVVPDGTEP